MPKITAIKRQRSKGSKTLGTLFYTKNTEGVLLSKETEKYKILNLKFKSIDYQ